MDSIQGSTLQGVEALNTATSQTSTTANKPISGEFNNMLNDVNLEYLSSSLSLNNDVKLGSLLELAQEQQDPEGELTQKFQGLDRQRSANIHSNANIMKAILSF